MARGRQHPTDSGWAWVVLLSTLGSHFLNGTLVYFVGVVHTALLDKFQPDTVTFVALTGAVYSAFACLAAPLAGYIVDRSGCRTCCVLGGLCCFAGFTSSAFVTSITQLFFTYGILAGVGVGFVYSATNITIGFYFDKLRGLASGISNSFQAIGVLSGSVIFQALLDEYAVSGAFLLLGAISLHFCFFGMFFRPTIYEGMTLTLEVVVEKPEQNDPEMLSACPNTVPDPVTSSYLQEHDRLGDQETVEMESEMPPLEKGLKDSANVSQHENRQEAPLNTETLDDTTADAETAEHTLDVDDDREVTFKESSEKCDTFQRREHKSSESSVVSSDSESVPFLQHKSQISHNSANDSSTHDIPLKDFSGENADDKDLNVAEEPDAGASGQLEDVSPLTANDAMEAESSVHVEDPKSKVQPDVTGRCGRRCRTLCSGPYLSTLLDKAFVLHCISLFVSNIHIAGVFLHLPEYAQLSGTTPSQAARLFFAVGSLSLVSKLSCGFATSDPRVDPLILSVGLMGLNGVVTCLFPLYSDSYDKQMVFSGLFGLYFGGLYALMNPILVQFVGVERLTYGYGASVFILGSGYMVGPILAGIMSLTGSFMDMGAACFLHSRGESNDVLHIAAASD